MVNFDHVMMSVFSHLADIERLRWGIVDEELKKHEGETLTAEEALAIYRKGAVTAEEMLRFWEDNHRMNWIKSGLKN